jgi:alpha-tubulin suppressor-like RCC1 family protein
VPPELENVVAVSCGYEHSVALTHDGRVVCWGQNDRGQCKVPHDLEEVVAVGCGCKHTSALLAAGKVICWGSD